MISAERALLRLRVQLPDEIPNAGVDLVPDLPNLRGGLTSRVFELPIEVALAWNERAFVAAPHGDHQVRLLGEFAGQELRGAAGEVDVDLVHDIDHLGMNLRGRRRARRKGVVPAARGLVEQGAAHLRTARVLAADEEDGAHQGCGSTTACASAG